MNIIKQNHKLNPLNHRLIKGSSGMMLISLVVTMVILAILGTAVVQMFSTQTMNEVSANLANKAQYIAESGYRYAASQYKNNSEGDGRDVTLTELDGNTYSLTPDPLSFSLAISSYFYGYDGTSYQMSAFASVPKEIAATTANGKVGIFTEGLLGQVKDYTGYSLIGTPATQIQFTPSDTSWPSTGTSRRTFPLVTPDSSVAEQTLLSSGNTKIPDNTDINLGNYDLSLMPAKHGPFRIYSEDNFLKYPDLLQYRELDTANKELIGIARLSGDSAEIKIDPTDYIVLQRFIYLESSGKAGDDTSNIFANRDLYYNVPVEAFDPLSWGAGGDPGSLSTGDDNIFDIIDLNEPGEETSLVERPEFSVSPGVKQYESVMQATGINIDDVENGIDNESAISFKFPKDFYNVHVNINWWRLVDLGLGMDFDKAYDVQDNTLSYEAQVKMRIWSGPPIYHFLTGISFRMNNNNVGGSGNEYYGVSLFRSQSETADEIDTDEPWLPYPPWLGRPKIQGGGDASDPGDGNRLADLDKDKTYVVLWKRIEGNIDGDGDGTFDDNIILLNAEEVSDTIANPYNVAAYYVDWASIVVKLEETETSGTKTNNFKIVVYDKNTNILQSIKWPTIDDWNGVTAITNNAFTTQGLTEISIPTKDDSGDYIEGCESCESCSGTCGWPEIGVHVFADANPDQKFYLDDFAVKLLGAGNPPHGVDVGFQPPIYGQ